jgi:hypothetical protein
MKHDIFGGICYVESPSGARKHGKMFELSRLKFNGTRVQLTQELFRPKFTNELVLLESLNLN